MPTYHVEFLIRLVPSSVVDVETEEHNGHVCFMRFFVALNHPMKGFCKGVDHTLPWMTLA
jgi:hypothetical protein